MNTKEFPQYEITERIDEEDFVMDEINSIHRGIEYHKAVFHHDDDGKYYMIEYKLPCSPDAGSVNLYEYSDDSDITGTEVEWVPEKMGIKDSGFEVVK
jgi:hypothetical protein